MVGFVETTVEVNETDRQATLNVSISSPPSDVALGFEIILLVSTADGSASTWYEWCTVLLHHLLPWKWYFPSVGSTAGFCRDSERNTTDFICISRSLELGNTQRSQTVSVDIRDDSIPEGVEELDVILSLQDMELATSVIVAPAVATVIIQDNDSKPLA